MNYILKLLNINRTYVIIISIIFLIVGSINNNEEKSINMKDAMLSFVPSALIIEKVINSNKTDSNLPDMNKTTASIDLLSDNNSFESDFIF